MVSIKKYRQYKLNQLRNSFRSPGIYGDVDQYMMDWLFDLLFIDQRSGQLRFETDRLNRQGRFRSTGTPGAFTALFPKFKNAPNSLFYCESASIWAEVAYRLGYLELERQLNEADWRAIEKNLYRFSKKSWHMKDIVDLFGLPSFVIDDGAANPKNRYFCYATGNPHSGWYYFDFVFSPDGYVDVKHKRGANPYLPMIDGFETQDHPDYQDPLLRSVRIPAVHFNKSVILTPYGRRCLGRPARDEL